MSKTIPGGYYKDASGTPRNANGEELKPDPKLEKAGADDAGEDAKKPGDKPAVVSTGTGSPRPSSRSGGARRRTASTTARGATGASGEATDQAGKTE